MWVFNLKQGIDSYRPEYKELLISKYSYFVFRAKTPRNLVIGIVTFSVNV